MPDFNIRGDTVDVEQIMERIRARIREKRGVDYTQKEIKELATVKLEKFLDPHAVRSDLVEHYRHGRPIVPPQPPVPALGQLPDQPAATENYGFEQGTIYESSRSLSGRLIATIRKLLNPLLKLFFNPNPIIRVLHMQSEMNDALVSRTNWSKAQLDRLTGRIDMVSERINTAAVRRGEIDLLNYEVLHNLVVEMTRVGIEVKNLKMLVESVSSRLDFNERRARALESVVQYRSAGTGPVPGGPGPDAPTASAPPSTAGAETPTQRAKRRRRRRRRGGGAAESSDNGTPETAGTSSSSADLQAGPIGTDEDGAIPRVDVETAVPGERGGEGLSTAALVSAAGHALAPLPEEGSARESNPADAPRAPAQSRSEDDSLEDR
jgi:hypothetical protein